MLISDIKRNITLKEYRQQKGLTQKMVANIIGISTSHYSNIENGKRGIKYDTAKKIAACYGITVEKIYQSFDN